MRPRPWPPCGACCRCARSSSTAAGAASRRGSRTATTGRASTGRTTPRIRRRVSSRSIRVASASARSSSPTAPARPPRRWASSPRITSRPSCPTRAGRTGCARSGGAASGRGPRRSRSSRRDRPPRSRRHGRHGGRGAAGRPLLDGLRSWRARTEGDAAVDYAVSLVITPQLEDAIAEMAGAVELGGPSFKAFMVYDFGVDDATLYRALAMAGASGGMLQVHCENAVLLEALTARHLEAGETLPRYHATSRPPYVEAEATARAGARARAGRAAPYVVHLSRRGGLVRPHPQRTPGHRDAADAGLLGGRGGGSDQPGADGGPARDDAGAAVRDAFQRGRGGGAGRRPRALRSRRASHAPPGGSASHERLHAPRGRRALRILTRTPPEP